ncbi:UDP-N-acetylglucosamine 2-epimerase (non-hydrolyzing) [Paenibacillus sp. HB172176]|uniref:non-hydrolyzing UDP-N-acetylglucosamine 2-epimerase n=1 Tax=Paenibacillus sp. HB172176 TaxID=2493690 RepID=UPI00143C9DCB|nr:UDP-N-acetylglucosamine 2-epimerase (non-hydrolyzing) [Paenibacillus sp. HB172176]
MKIATIVGARPQFIKAAPLSKTLREKHREILIHTGQHYDRGMSDVFFQQLGLPLPDFQLAAGSATHGRQTARMLEGIEEILLQAKPDIVLVYGDTNSTVAGSLAASKLHIPIAHVESGLRSYNRAMPEEINRVVTDHLSSLLFCPTDQALRQLKAEGIEQGVHLVGDIMVDGVQANLGIALKQSSILETMQLAPRSYCVATIHRAENTDSPHAMEQILKGLSSLGDTVILPLHPRTASCLEKWKLTAQLGRKGFIRVCDPLPYLDMLRLCHHAKAIITDSGGLQKEAYLLGVPCLTIRKETEWVETIDAGWNRLLPAESLAIQDAYAALSRPAAAPSLYGDGNTASRIRKLIEAYMLTMQ